MEEEKKVKCTVYLSPETIRIIEGVHKKDGYFQCEGGCKCDTSVHDCCISYGDIIDDGMNHFYSEWYNFNVDRD